MGSFRVVRPFVSVCAVLLACLTRSSAENVVFPPNTPGVSDITEAPYYADNTGQTDVTAILNLALDENRGAGNWASRIVYLPNGTYLVSGEVSWQLPPYTLGPHLQGQSKAGTVIKLKDSTWVSPTQIGFVLKTGGDVAQNFNRGLFNLTVNTGVGNPGAIGVKWYANNQALMSDIDIIDGDGRGAAGLQVGGIEQGPSGVRRVYINGFRFGVLARPSVMSATLTEISVENQAVYGVYHTGNCPLFIDSLYSDNTVPAVYNGATSAQMVLVNAHLVGGSAANTAIINEPGAGMFVRDVRTEGYARAIQTTDTPNPAPTGTTISEYVTHTATTLFDGPPMSLNLPVKRAPAILWEQDMSRWADIEDYTSGRSDAQALQAAIDDASKTTVVLPEGRDYDLGGGEVYVRGNIHMIIATGGGFQGTGSIVVTDGTPETVYLLKLSGPQPGQSPGVVSRTSRTVVVENHLLSPQGYGVLHEGTGDVFYTDGVSPMKVDNPQAHAYAWQYDAEGGSYQLEVAAGTVRIFGWKDEGVGTSGRMTGGVTEVIGFYNYHGDDVPQFILQDAAFSLALGMKGIFGSGYNILVRETRGGETRELLASENSTGYPSSFCLPLFTSYDPTELDKPATESRSDRSPGAVTYRVSGQVLRIHYPHEGKGLLSIRLLDAAGRVVRECGVPSGSSRQDISVAGMPDGIYWLELEAPESTRTQTVTLVQ